MSDPSFSAPEEDPYRPPEIPIMVVCSHCGREFDSYLMVWEEVIIQDEKVSFWACPTEGCEGTGFGIDIHPLDPDYGKEYQPYVPEAEDEMPDGELIDNEISLDGDTMDTLFNPQDGAGLDIDDEVDDDDDCPWSPF